MTETHALKEGLVGPAWEALSGSARGLTRLLGSAGAGAVSATPSPLRTLLAGVLTSLEQLPSATGELEVLMAEVRAQRLGLQAMQAELDALDRQLEVLERSLAPLSALGHQIARLRMSLDELLVETPDGSEEPARNDQRSTTSTSTTRASTAHHVKERQQ